MIGWCKLISETSDKMKIAYSLEKNKNCDGELTYDKITKEFTIEKLPEGEDGWLTNHFICPLRSRIREAMELGKRYMVMTG